MRVEIISIFPELFRGVFDFGIIRRAREASILDVRVHDLRDWTKDRHRSTDDEPYGGGPGMVMKVEPLMEAVETIVDDGLRPERREVVLLSPRGQILKQEMVWRFARLDQLVLVAGRYEGVDERFVELTGAREVSIGDYVLSGGEIPVMVLVDGVTRLLPGAISDPESARDDSFSRGLLDYPHYTRPDEFRNAKVPGVLRSGNHAAIRRWRKERALRDTRARRPDLLLQAQMDEEERAIMRQLEQGGGVLIETN